MGQRVGIRTDFLDCSAEPLKQVHSGRDVHRQHFIKRMEDPYPEGLSELGSLFGLLRANADEDIENIFMETLDRSRFDSQFLLLPAWLPASKRDLQRMPVFSGYAEETTTSAVTPDSVCNTM